MKYIIIWVAFLISIIIVLPLTTKVIFFSYNEEQNYINTKDKLSVLFTKENEVKVMGLEEYILGVLMAEMPASFEFEALKAQAVAARTYTINKIENSTIENLHADADICTDFSHCQAYITKEDALKKWNKNASENFKKCKNAVLKTAGEIMLYNNEPVKAVFHSTSSGRTENAKDVWGGNVPYLTSVESEGDNLSPSYKSVVSLEIKKFKEVLKDFDVNFSNQLFSDIIRTKGGSVKTIRIGDKQFEGKKIRSLFNLRSSCFDVKVNGDNVVFYVTGNGHGVGMSQYGANFMASKGYNYKEILKKYYTGVKIGNINE